jgi:streptogramin lyase
MALLLASSTAFAACDVGGSPQSSQTPPPALPDRRVPIPTDDGYLGLAVDGQGTAWFTEANSSRLGRYRAGQTITEIALQPNGNPRTLRSAPDGSLWFAEPGLQRLGHIASDGKVTEKSVNAGEFSPNWGVAVGADGSVWYDLRNGLARLMPDGSLRTYPVQVNGTVTIDSHGNAWVPMATVEVVRVSEQGQVAEFKFDNTIDMVAEAADGAMWFVDGSRGGPRVGRIDQNGQPRFFDALNAQGAGFPNGIVRAPDGAVWFTMRDHRLVRLASESDVKVYRIPWADITPGPFVVLARNRMLMLGHHELLDFTPKLEGPVAGAQAIPTPTPYVPKDAAEAAAHAMARQNSGAEAQIELSQAWEGSHASAFLYSVSYAVGGHALYVYVYEQGGSWHVYDSYGTQNLQPPSPELQTTLKFKSGCLNVREAPSLTSKVVSCLGSGTQIQIDGLPAYADGYFWWHLASRGWAAHKFLYCNEFTYSGRPDC